MDTSFLNYIKQSTTLPEQKQAFPLPAPPTSVGPVEQPLKPFSFQGSATPIDLNMRTGLIQSISDQVFSKPIKVNPLEQYNLQGIFYGTPEQIQQQKDNAVKSIMFSPPDVLQQAGVSDDIFGKIAGALSNFAQSAQSYLGETVLPQVEQAAGYTGMAFPQSEFGGLGQAWKMKQEKAAEEAKLLKTFELNKKLEQEKSSIQKSEENLKALLDLAKSDKFTPESKKLFSDAIAKGQNVLEASYLLDPFKQDDLNIKMMLAEKQMQAALVKALSGDKKDYKTFLDAVEKNPLYKKLNEQEAAGFDAKTMIELGNPITDQALLTKVARLFGEVGVLSDSDVKRFGGSKAVFDKVQKNVNVLFTGKLDNKTRKQYAEAINVAIKASQENKNKFLNKSADQWGKALNVDPAELRNIVSSGYTEQNVVRYDATGKRI